MDAQQQCVGFCFCVLPVLARAQRCSRARHTPLPSNTNTSPPTYSKKTKQQPKKLEIIAPLQPSNTPPRDIPFQLAGYTDVPPEQFSYMRTPGGHWVAAAQDTSGRLFMIDEIGDLYYDSGDAQIGLYAVGVAMFFCVVLCRRRRRRCCSFSARQTASHTTPPPPLHPTYKQTKT